RFNSGSSKGDDRIHEVVEIINSLGSAPGSVPGSAGILACLRSKRLTQPIGRQGGLRSQGRSRVGFLRKERRNQAASKNSKSFSQLHQSRRRGNRNGVPGEHSPPLPNRGYRNPKHSLHRDLRLGNYSF